jgi:hypothetical protein
VVVLPELPGVVTAWSRRHCSSAAPARPLHCALGEVLSVEVLPVEAPLDAEPDGLVPVVPPAVVPGAPPSVVLVLLLASEPALPELAPALPESEPELAPAPAPELPESAPELAPAPDDPPAPPLPPPLPPPWAQVAEERPRRAAVIAAVTTFVFIMWNAL